MYKNLKLSQGSFLFSVQNTMREKERGGQRLSLLSSSLKNFKELPFLK